MYTFMSNIIFKIIFLGSYLHFTCVSVNGLYNVHINLMYSSSL